LCSGNCRQQAKRKGIKLRRKKADYKVGSDPYSNGPSKRECSVYKKIEGIKDIIPSIEEDKPKEQLSEYCPSIFEPLMPIFEDTELVKLKIAQLKGQAPMPPSKRIDIDGTRKQEIPARSFRDYIDLLKTGKYDREAVRKEVQADKKLSPPQKSTLYSKLT
jgi:hypothetical protein